MPWTIIEEKTTASAAIANYNVDDKWDRELVLYRSNAGTTDKMVIEEINVNFPTKFCFDFGNPHCR